jgi:Uma2 family endonuclease
MTTRNPTAAPPVTLEEYAALPQQPRYELVKGVLIEQMTASEQHELTVGLVIYELIHYNRSNPLGRVYGSNRGYVTVPDSPASSRMPDVSFLSAERAGQLDLFGMLYDGSPDLAVEILSPSNTIPEINQKIEEYLNSGCKSVWIIDIRTRTLTVHTVDAPPQSLSDGDAVSGAEALPGFSCPVAALLPSND